ncbi:hypothetical protein ACN38_g10986, partial [Penicillium nordicum]
MVLSFLELNYEEQDIIFHQRDNVLRRYESVLWVSRSKGGRILCSVGAGQKTFSQIQFSSDSIQIQFRFNSDS